MSASTPLRPNCRPLRYCAAAAVPASLCGYDAGAVYADFHEISDVLTLSSSGGDIVIGTLGLGIFIGIFLGGWICYGSGRRIALLAGSVFGCLSLVAVKIAPGFGIMLCAQVAAGFAFGMYVLAAMLYIDEISPSSSRGFALSCIGLSLSIGAGAAAWCAGTDLGRSVIFTILLLLNFAVLIYMLLRLPESPRWLALAGSSDAALSVLVKLRADAGAAARELAFINECCRSAERGAAFFMQNSNFRRVIWVLVAILALQHAAGYLFLPYRMRDLIAQSEFSAYHLHQIAVYGLFIMITLAAATTAAASDRLGRRRLMIISTMLSCLFLMPIAVILSSDFSVSNLMPGLMLELMFTYTAMTAHFTLMMIMAAELMPTRGRELGLASLLFFDWVALLSSLQGSRSLVDELVIDLLMTLCVSASLILCALVYIMIPETSRQSLESIENRLLSGGRVAEIGRWSGR